MFFMTFVPLMGTMSTAAVTMFMTMSVLVAVGAFAAIRIRHERPCDVRLHGLIRISLHP